MDNLLQPFLENIRVHFSAKSISRIDKMQTLWSGYGGIYRLNLEGAQSPSVVVKCIALQEKADHPRGWATSHSHQRKLKSYEVEQCWYQDYAHTLPESVKVAKNLYVEKGTDVKIIVLEDLSSHYPALKKECTYSEALMVVNWLAQFHAFFLNSSSVGLWPVGSYWHLDTRPDEWKVMEDSLLKTNAGALDILLNQAKFQTIIHGDAKVVNFCFNEDASKVAAVDFQYVGQGVGVKDLIYFMGSCFTSEECALYESALVDYYFSQLLIHVNLSSEEKEALKKEWQGLYAVAWADFNRFLLGWLPSHHKLHNHALTKNDEAFLYLKENS